MSAAQTRQATGAPEPYEIDSVQYVAAQMQNLEDILTGLCAEHFGPDFRKACEMAYATRRYLEIELTQYEPAPGEVLGDS